MNRRFTAVFLIFLSVSLVCACAAETVIPKKDALGRKVLVLEVLEEGGAADSGPLKTSDAPAQNSEAIPAADLENTADDFLARHASALGVCDPASELKVRRQDTDQFGITHVQYEQRMAGLPVIGAETIVHVTKQGRVRGLNANAAITKAINPNPAIPFYVAETVARAAWRDEFGTVDAEEVGYPVLKVYQPSVMDPRASDDAFLVWEVRLKSPGCRIVEDRSYYVDAHTADVRFSLSWVRQLYRRIADCSMADEPGIGFCSSQYYSAKWNYTFGRRESTPRHTAPNPRFLSYDTDDAYDLTGVVLYYWLRAFGRNGANFLGGNTNLFYGTYSPDVAVVNTFTDPVWASCPSANTYVDGTVAFCKGMVVPSVFGHEMQHVIDNFAFRDSIGHALGITYYGQSGAVDESYADFFGERLKLDMLGIVDWVHGSDGPGTKRNLRNPSAMGYPDTFYSGAYDCVGGGEMHRNSLVLGKAWYLMCEGGTFNGVTIAPTAREKVEATAYRALNTYFTQTMTFNACYYALLQASEDLNTPAETAEIRKALQAVELDQPGACSGVPELPPAADQRQALFINGRDIAQDTARSASSTYRYQLIGKANPGGAYDFTLDTGTGTVNVISVGFPAVVQGDMVKVTGRLDTSQPASTIRARPEDVHVLTNGSFSAAPMPIASVLNTALSSPVATPASGTVIPQFPGLVQDCGCGK